MPCLIDLLQNHLARNFELGEDLVFLIPTIFIFVKIFKQKAIFLDFVNDIKACDLLIVVRVGVNRLDCEQL